MPNSLLGPGYRVTTSRATACITKCQATPATQADYPNCTHEIPVHVEGHANKIKFANPITFILSDYATVCPCNLITSPYGGLTPNGTVPCQRDHHAELLSCWAQIRNHSRMRTSPAPWVVRSIWRNRGVNTGKLSSSYTLGMHRPWLLRSRPTGEDTRGASGMWNFRLGLPDGAMIRLQDDVLARVSFIILLVGAA